MIIYIYILVVSIMIWLAQPSCRGQRLGCPWGVRCIWEQWTFTTTSGQPFTRNICQQSTHESFRSRGLWNCFFPGFLTWNEFNKIKPQHEQKDIHIYIYLEPRIVHKFLSSLEFLSWGRKFWKGTEIPGEGKNLCCDVFGILTHTWTSMSLFLARTMRNWCLEWPKGAPPTSFFPETLLHTWSLQVHWVLPSSLLHLKAGICGSICGWGTTNFW